MVSNLWQRHFSWLVLATIAAGLGTGALLATLTQSTPVRTAATAQGLPPVMTPGPGGAGSSNSAGAPQSAGGAGNTGVMGTVASIDAGVATVRGQQGDVKVTLAHARVVTSADGAIEDLKSGQRVTAIAQQDAEGGLTASSLQIASGELPVRGAVLQGAAAGDPSQARGQGQQNTEAQARAVSGTISGLEAGTVTISTGQEEVKLKIAGARIQKQVEGSIQDLQSGQRVLVSGTRGSDGSYASAEIQILAATGQGPTGGGSRRQGQ